MKKIIVLSVFLLSGFMAIAQVTTTYYERKDAFQQVSELHQSKEFSTKRMPQVDVEKLLKEDEEDEANGFPFRFGHDFDVDYGLSDGTWEELDKWRVWSLKIVSPGAYSLNFIFNELKLSPNAELYIFNTEGSMVHGPITEKQNLKEGLHLTDLVAGDEVIIQLREPAINTFRSSLKISSVVHGYKNLFPFISGSNIKALSCHNNVDCYPAWSKESDAVAMILLNGNSFCSGSLLNNTSGNYKPYFLTAFHCIDLDIITKNCTDGVLSPSEIARVSNWAFRFNYKTTCSTGSSTSWITYNSATLKAAWQGSYFALVEINQTLNLNNHYFLGWDKSRSNTPKATGIHHPDGMPMKISFANSSPLVIGPAGLTWDSCGLSTPGWTHWAVRFDSGTTENCSSGSPLFDNNQRVIGQLHGGGTGCAPITKYYGMFSDSWTGGGSSTTRLSDWLNPTGSSTNTTNTVKLGVSIVGPPNVMMCGEYYASLSGCTNPSGNNYIWSVTPSSNAYIDYYFGYNNCNARVNFSVEGYYDIKAQITNSCGTQYEVITVYAKPYKGSSGSSIAFPNPVDDILNIDLDQITSVLSKSVNSYDIRLFDEQGNMVRQSSAKSGIIQFDVSKLPDGICYLRIYDGISVTPEIHKVIVKH